MNDGYIFENGVWGVAPMRVVSRWCRCIVQRLCATDFKRPCLVRAAAPHSATARMPCVYSQGLCRDAKPTKHTQPFMGKGGSSARMPKKGHTKLSTRQSHQSVLKGIGIINQKFISKTNFSTNYRRTSAVAFFLPTT